MDGLQILAHELSHVMQQGSIDAGSDLQRLEVDPEHTPLEREAETNATSVLLGRRPQGSSLATNPIVSRRGSMPVQVRPPVRQPVRSPGGRAGSGAEGRPANAPGTYQEPIWVPDRFDNSPEAGYQRRNIRDYAERQRMEAERPVATLQRGGQPPSFITEQGTRTVSWVGGPSGAGSVTARNRRFHVLDSIEYQVSRASTEADLRRILEDHAPGAAFQDRVIEIARTGRDPNLTGLGVLRPQLLLLWETPEFRPDFDPRAEARLQVFEAAVRKRSQLIPALANSRLISKRPGISPYTTPRVGPDPEASEESSKRGCEPGVGAQLGGHDCHDAYAMSISGVPREFTLRTPEGVLVSFDALGPDGVLYEVKTGHRALAFNRNLPNRQERINKMIGQSLLQAAVAARCGYSLVWIFNDQAAQGYFDSVVLPRTTYQPFKCDVETD
jgi:hypothetical protein